MFNSSIGYWIAKYSISVDYFATNLCRPVYRTPQDRLDVNTVDAPDHVETRGCGENP